MLNKPCLAFALAALALISCSKDPTGPAVDMAHEHDAAGDAGAEQDLESTPDMTDVPDQHVADVGVDMEVPDMTQWVLDPLPDAPPEDATDASRAAGFKLYYAERVNRILTAGHRYWFMGDTGWATTTRGPKVARSGNQYEVLVGPSDNNRIGNTVWNVYNAYRVFRTRELELTLIRLLNGLVFFEEVTGHPGMTSRAAYPGWTRVVDGVNGTTTHSRLGAAITAPPLGQNIQADVISTFFAGLEFTYRENPEDFLFNLFPAFDPGKYAMTISFIELPKTIRSGECCSSLLSTPDGRGRWAGAYWNNHNSRDNFPDLGLGYLAARLVADDATMPTDVQAAGDAAAQGGEAIGDLILANDMSIMTVSNYGADYDTFEISGTLRPHGEPENQDLGSLGVCTMAFMAQAMSSEGLNPGEPIPLPYSTDKEFFSSPQLQANLGCDIPDEPTCVTLNDGFCGRPWGAFQQLEYQGQPIFEWFEANPQLAQALLESWQNDFDDVTEAAMVVYHYARHIGEEALVEQARRAVYDLTELQNALADYAFGDDEARRARQRLRSNLYKAECDLPASTEDFAEFAQYEAEAAFVESVLTLGDTQPAALLTAAEIQSSIDARLAGALEHVVERYNTTYPGEPPVRRTMNGYEARGDDINAWPWREVEVPRHASLGSPPLLEAIPLCEQAPHWLSCEWAVLGCARPDLDSSGTVDGSDVALFDAAQTMFAGQACDDQNNWCDGADLDRSGTSDASDRAFIEAADGCWY